MPRGNLDRARDDADEPEAEPARDESLATSVPQQSGVTRLELALLACAIAGVLIAIFRRLVL